MKVKRINPTDPLQQRVTLDAVRKFRPPAADARFAEAIQDQHVMFAQAWIETMFGVVLQPGNFRLILPRAAKGAVRIPVGPLIAVTSVQIGGAVSSQWKLQRDFLSFDKDHDAEISIEFLAGFKKVPLLVEKAIAKICWHWAAHPEDFEAEELGEAYGGVSQYLELFSSSRGGVPWQ